MTKKKGTAGRGPAKTPAGERRERRNPKESPEPTSEDRAPAQPRNREEGIRRLHEATDEINGVW